MPPPTTITASELLHLKDKHVSARWRSKAEWRVNFVFHGCTVSRLANRPSAMGKVIYDDDLDTEEIAASAPIEGLPVTL